MTKKTSKAKFITPPNYLKVKAGGGGIPEERLERAQLAMDDFKSDFRPEALKMVENLSAGTTGALKALKDGKAFEKDKMIFPIMQLKANGGMFKYQLLSDIADICLQFMEAVNDFTPEAIDIIKAHENTINIVISNDLKGDGGKEGYTLVQELHKACTRYFKKYNI